MKDDELLAVLFPENTDTQEECTASEPEDKHQEIKESERNKLLKHIGALALVLAKQNGRYKRGEKLSANAIADAAIAIIEEIGANSYRCSNPSIRASIAAGVELLKN